GPLGPPAPSAPGGTSTGGAGATGSGDATGSGEAVADGDGEGLGSCAAAACERNNGTTTNDSKTTVGDGRHKPIETSGLGEGDLARLGQRARNAELFY